MTQEEEAYYKRSHDAMLIEIQRLRDAIKKDAAELNNWRTKYSYTPISVSNMAWAHMKECPKMYENWQSGKFNKPDAV